MKTTVEQRRNWAKWVLATAFAILVLAVVLFATGCSSTVVPGRTAAGAIAYEGTQQNAGVLGVLPDGRPVLTERKKAEYDALVAIYARGTDVYVIAPPVDPGRGLVQRSGADVGFPEQVTVWIIDQEHAAWFVAFREWQRSGRKPR